jgi:hypothetical protein
LTNWRDFAQKPAKQNLIGGGGFPRDSFLLFQIGRHKINPPGKKKESLKKKKA